MTDSTARQSWQDKLDHLQKEQALAVDAEAKFSIAERIREAKAKLAELEASPAQISMQRTASSQLPPGTAKLFGRDAELARLLEAWSDPQVRVVTLVAFGGVGKTSLVRKLVADLADRNYDGADFFDWPFHTKGAHAHIGASADAFVDAALRFFGDAETADSAKVPWDKGARLAELICKRRSLLVLDGLEALQTGSRSLHSEDLQDQAIRALLRGLAARNPGLCVVTTRLPLSDLENFRERSAPEWRLDLLPTQAGFELLSSLGVRGTRAEIDQLVVDVKGHALTINLIGHYLRDAHYGDVRRRDLFRLDEADEENGGHAFAIIAAYEKFFESGGARGQRQLAILRLLGLFDRPASHELLADLRRTPAIPELTESLIELNDGRWNATLSHLVKSGLVENQNGTVDTHPLIREYFSQQLREHYPAAWRAAHGRLFEHLKNHKNDIEYQPTTLVGLQPLYQAVYHGCQAGRHEEARAGVYRDRILRGTGAGANYSLKKLGAFGADLAAIAWLFEAPWQRVASTLAEGDKAWLLSQAAFCLGAMGRLLEAVNPMRAGLEKNVQQEDWKGAARSATNLSEIQLKLGLVWAAVADAEQSVFFADRSRDTLLRLVSRSMLADARHQAGDPETALELFRESECLQVEREANYPFLYSLRGYQYCDLLLTPAELAAASGRGDILAVNQACNEIERRAPGFSQGWKKDFKNASLLDIALDRLSRGRARLYRKIVVTQGRSGADARPIIEQAVDGLRNAGQLQYLPLGLLTRAWLRHFEGDLEGARADLDEAEEIAQRGEMKLHLADVALYRARLFNNREALAKAKDLVEKCGYGRRRAEIAILEERLGPVPG